MSSKRAGDMAKIELSQIPQPSPDSTNSGGNNSPIDTVLSPMPGTPKVVPDDEVDTSGKATPKPDEEDQEDEGTDVTNQGTNRREFLRRGATSAWGAVNSVKNGIGNIAMPGGLALPIITLLVLFLLIVQVNGKSRFSWLWLVLTNNAFVDTNPSNPGNADNSGSSTTSNGAGSNFGTTPGTTTIPPGTFGAGNDAGGYGGGTSGDFGSSTGFAGDPNVNGSSGNFGTSAYVSMSQEFV